MSTTSQIFLLFYAIFYGAIFTISDRWRPFFISHNSKIGKQRFLLSLFFYGALPVIYFVGTFYILLTVTENNIINIIKAVYLVAPLFAFYLIWLWIVIWKREIFYNKSDFQIEPLKSSFHWIGEKPLSATVIIFCMVLFLVGPLIILTIYWINYLCH